MLYVVQVRVGSEEKTVNECLRLISDTCDIYSPKRQEYYKLNGIWTQRVTVLFPGYIFVDTDDVNKLFHELKKVPSFAYLVRFKDSIVSVSEEEVHLIQKLSGKDRVMDVSQGVMVGNRIQVTAGPLIGLEGLIVGIDRHKRKAWLETTMFGRKQTIKVNIPRYAYHQSAQ